MTTGDAIVTIHESLSTMEPVQESKKDNTTVSTTEMSVYTSERQPSQYLPAGSAHIGLFEKLKWLRRDGLIKYCHHSPRLTRRLHAAKKWTCLHLLGTVILAIPLAVFGTKEKKVSIRGVGLFGLFAWLEISWTALFLSLLLVSLIKASLETVARNFTTKAVKWTQLVTSLEECLTLLIGDIIAVSTLPTIHSINVATDIPTDEAMPGWISTVRKVLLITLAVIAVFMVEKVVVLYVKSSYRRLQIRGQLDVSRNKVHAIKSIYKAVHRYPLDERIATALELYYEMIHSPLRSTSPGHFQSKLHESVKHRMAHLGSHVTSALFGIEHELATCVGLDEHDATVHVALEKPESSRALGTILWHTIGGGSKPLTKADFLRVLVQDRTNQHLTLDDIESEATRIFDLFDEDCNGDMSLEEVQEVVIALGRQLESLKNNRIGVEGILKTLDTMLMGVASAAAIFIYATFFSSYFLAHISTLVSVFGATAFAFSSSVAELTASSIFVFEKHPFDNEDKVEINGVQLIVARISLLYTKFYQVDTGCIVQIPNSVNNGAWINNISRSKVMKERIHISVDASTSAGDIQALQQDLEDFVKHGDNNREFYPSVLVHVSTVKDLSTLELQIEFRHKGIWAKEKVRLQRRAKFLTYLISAVKKVPLNAPGATGPASGSILAPKYSVTISEEVATAARARAAAEKEASDAIRQRTRQQTMTPS